MFADQDPAAVQAPSRFTSPQQASPALTAVPVAVVVAWIETISELKSPAPARFPCNTSTRAAGVSDDEVDGTIVRCALTGSFQPLLKPFVVTRSSHCNQHLPNQPSTQEGDRP
jgi:hypothetical protein